QFLRRELVPVSQQLLHVHGLAPFGARGGTGSLPTVSQGRGTVNGSRSRRRPPGPGRRSQPSRRSAPPLRSSTRGSRARPRADTIPCRDVSPLVGSMSRTTNGALLHYLDSLAQEAREQTDGHLLDRFVAGRDEAAFTALLRRHGPLVLRVCRRVLR